MQRIEIEVIGTVGKVKCVVCGKVACNRLAIRDNGAIVRVVVCAHCTFLPCEFILGRVADVDVKGGAVWAGSL
jgi:hypothetical protein